jgi:hypothetical protein
MLPLLALKLITWPVTAVKYDCVKCSALLMVLHVQIDAITDEIAQQSKSPLRCHS